MIEIETQASLTAFGYPPCWVTAVIIEQTPAQRLGRAFAGLGMCWALALGGLFIPVAHFILVPTFVVAGIIVTVKRAREDRRLVLLRGVCPRCGAAAGQGSRAHDAAHGAPGVNCRGRVKAPTTAVVVDGTPCGRRRLDLIRAVAKGTRSADWRANNDRDRHPVPKRLGA